MSELSIRENWRRGTDLKSASGSPGAPTTRTGGAVPGISTVALGGAPAEPSDEAMRTPRQRDAARVVAGGEGKGRGGSVGGEGGAAREERKGTAPWKRGRGGRGRDVLVCKHRT